MARITVPGRRVKPAQGQIPFQQLATNPGQFGAEQAAQVQAFGGAVKSLAAAFKSGRPLQPAAPAPRPTPARPMAESTLLTGADPNLDPVLAPPPPAPVSVPPASPADPQLQQKFRTTNAQANQATATFIAQERAAEVAFRATPDGLGLPGEPVIASLNQSHEEIGSALPPAARSVYNDITAPRLAQFDTKIAVLDASKSVNFQRAQSNQRVIDLAQDAIDTPGRLEVIETEITRELSAAVASGLLLAQDFDTTLNSRISAVRRAAAFGLLDTAPKELLERVGADMSSVFTGLHLDEPNRTAIAARARAILASRADAQEITNASLEYDFAKALHTSQIEGRLTAAQVGMCVGRCDPETIGIFAGRNDGGSAESGQATGGGVTNMLGIGGVDPANRAPIGPEEMLEFDEHGGTTILDGEGNERPGPRAADIGLGSRFDAGAQGGNIGRFILVDQQRQENPVGEFAGQPQADIGSSEILIDDGAGAEVLAQVNPPNRTELDKFFDALSQISEENTITEETTGEDRITQRIIAAQIEKFDESGALVELGKEVSVSVFGTGATRKLVDRAGLDDDEDTLEMGAAGIVVFHTTNPNFDTQTGTEEFGIALSAKTTWLFDIRAGVSFTFDGEIIFATGGRAGFDEFGRRFEIDLNHGEIRVVKNNRLDTDPFSSSGGASTSQSTKTIDVGDMVDDALDIDFDNFDMGQFAKELLEHGFRLFRSSDGGSVFISADENLPTLEDLGLKPGSLNPGNRAFEPIIQEFSDGE